MKYLYHVLLECGCTRYEAANNRKHLAEQLNGKKFAVIKRELND